MSEGGELVLDLDLNSLTINEIDAIETETGMSIVKLAELLQSGEQPMAKVLRAIGYVVKHREDPSFTMEMAGELVVNLGAEALDPTSAAGSKGPRRSATSTRGTRSPRLAS